MELALFGFFYLLLMISIINYFTIRTPGDSREVSESISVLLPVRNEEKNVAQCIEALKTQISIPQVRFIVIDDQSTDKTPEILASAIAGDNRFTVLNTAGPRPGWLGKVSALQTGYLESSSDFLITLDADVTLKSNAIASAINQLKDTGLDFLSPYPQQIAQSFSEKLIQPLLHWSWMTTVILRLAEKKPHASTAVANGQFFVARKLALDEVSGFTSVQNKILDDIEIARSLIASGFRGAVVEGSELAQTRMYENFGEIKDGYGKSLHKAFGGALGSLVAVIFIFLTGVLPVIYIALGSPIGWLLYSSIVFTRLLSDSRSKSDSFYALLHPVSSLILIYLIAYSWKNRGKIQWKGRTV